MRARCLTWLLLAPISLSAQTMSMPMHQGDMSMAPLSDKARQQIAASLRAASLLDTPEKAREAGYRPRFGDVPLQGIHWSNPSLVISGKFDVDHPPTLMFVPINGKDSLVGVAYTYEVRDGGPMPDGFDGAAMWHEHPALSLPGHRLVMTHVWFIDSPNGPFAHDNPRLPFLERDMSYPPAGWLDAETTRRLALALSLARRQAPGNGQFRMGGRVDSAVARLGLERDSVDAAAQQLETLRRAGKRDDYRRLAIEIGNASDAMIATIKSIPADPMTQLVLGRLLDETLAEHTVKP